MTRNMYTAPLFIVVSVEDVESVYSTTTTHKYFGTKKQHIFLSSKIYYRSQFKQLLCRCLLTISKSISQHFFCIG